MDNLSLAKELLSRVKQAIDQDKLELATEWYSGVASFLLHGVSSLYELSYEVIGSDGMTKLRDYDSKISDPDYKIGKLATQIEELDFGYKNPKSDECKLIAELLRNV